MKILTHACMTLVCLAALITPVAQSVAQDDTSCETKIVTFRDPDAGTDKTDGCQGRCGTTPVAINREGAIVGTYIDKKMVGHGFLRAPDGTFTNFDPPGATFTGFTGINGKWISSGYFTSTGNPDRGFVRAREGTLSVFSAASGIRGTYPVSINAKGETAGYYTDMSFVDHGFVRAPNGTITTFDVPAATGTTPVSISGPGVVTGSFTVGNVSHGFVRTPDGTITTFDGPVSGFTIPLAINRAGTITGYYRDTFLYRGFVRAPDGTITTFDPPGSNFTVPQSINREGSITGYYPNPDIDDADHGFVRASDGTITTFDVPNASSGTGTLPFSVNAAGWITGFYQDADTLINRGFLRRCIQKND